MRQNHLRAHFLRARQRTETICAPLEREDYVPQPILDVSPPKWHLAHTTWFFETFILSTYLPAYEAFNPAYAFLFNSYYNHEGERVPRDKRGYLSRPTVPEVFAYRKAITDAVDLLLQQKDLPSQLLDTLEIGIQHEEQHQELLVYDIQYILGSQPTMPAYGSGFSYKPLPESAWITLPEGLYPIGYRSDGFCFDNEKGAHQVFLPAFEIAREVVRNAEYLEFIEEGGYQNFRYWLAEGWDLLQKEKWQAPLYWKKQGGDWYSYQLSGFQKLHPDEPLRHVSFFEAQAFATWKGCRLPTEFEWEAAAAQLKSGQVWEWTYSAYLPYPGFSIAPGALGEYNGKFMSNQHVLRGSSIATAPGHSRSSYRNFFPTGSRWLFSGLRLTR
ncbi:MAG: ergothioneine biosynthesis protein EgtB [Nitritalea sp.]